MLTLVLHIGPEGKLLDLRGARPGMESGRKRMGATVVGANNGRISKRDGGGK